MKNQKSQKNTIRKDWLFLLTVVLATAVVIMYLPNKSSEILQTSADYLKQMALIFPAVLILMGLFSVWISREFVMTHLGDSSGLKGILVAFVMGTMPTGPVYIAFPMAQALRQKGASYTNIVIFLSAWACIKLPQELVELQFMGAKFMWVRLSLTIIFITIMGIIIDKIFQKNKEEA